MMKTLLLASALLGAAIPTGAMAAANPASVFCGKMGGRTVIATLSGGDQIGLCYLPGRKIVEEWTLFRMLDGKMPVRGRNPFASK